MASWLLVRASFIPRFSAVRVIDRTNEVLDRCQETSTDGRGEPCVKAS
jgi:hypothetical protein